MARVVGSKAWEKCKTACPPSDGTICYGVKFSPDGAEVALSVALKPHDGTPHVEVVCVRSMAEGLTWLVDWLCARADRAAQIVIDGQSNAQELTDRLLSARIPKGVLVRPTTGEMCAACSTFVTAINEGNVTHFDQESLNASVTKSSKRRIGSRGGWGFESTSDADATLAESVALAYWQSVNTKRDPTKKGRAGC
jgi:hypothetical protein